MRRVRWILPLLLLGVLLAPATATAEPDPQPAPSTERAAVPEGDNGPLTGVRQVTSGYYHSCALLTSGQVRCWGLNGDGELGNGDDADTNRAVVTKNASGTGPLVNVTQISAGIYSTCALLTNHQVRCWGEGQYGVLGNGDDTERHLPVAVRAPTGAGNLTNVVQIAAGGYHTCALLATGQVRCWGLNGDGQLGNGQAGMGADRLRPIVVRNPSNSGPLQDVASLGLGYYSSCATLENQQARCWGDNDYYQLADGTNVDRHLPRVVKNPSGTAPLTGVRFMDVSYEVGCALLTNRQVRCAGDNDYGELGNDDAGNDSHLLDTVLNVPGTGPLTTVTQLTVGDYLVCARLANGQARCWGDGDYGGMGNGDLVTVNPRPVAVLNAAATSALTGIAQINANDYTACARLTNGQARCWGYGSNGGTGRGTTEDNNPNTAAVVT